MDQKQADLVTVFAAYVASIPLFGLAYFLLYRRRRTNFVFASDVYSSRLSKEKRLADDQIGWLRLLLDYFEQLAIDYSHGAVREERSKDTAFFYLSDRRSLVLEKHIAVGHPQARSVKELSPFVRLVRADGTKEQEGRIFGHGLLSEFREWADYILAMIQPLKMDLRAAEAHRLSLDSPNPKIWRYLDFVYFSMITQSTVGYGDILPNSTSVRCIVILQLVVAYAILVLILNFVMSK